MNTKLHGRLKLALAPLGISLLSSGLIYAFAQHYLGIDFHAGTGSSVTAVFAAVGIGFTSVVGIILTLLCLAGAFDGYLSTRVANKTVHATSKNWPWA